MSDRVYVGPNVSDLDIGEKTNRISRVNILVDSEHQYTAGDDTGRTLERTVPWGSQAMADTILAAIKDHDYQPFTGTEALLDPAAEIGDGITVGGVYSVLAQRDITFGRMSTTEISAPGTDEIEDEYPYLSRSQRQANRQLAETRSSITKTAEQIRLEVKNEVDGLSSSIDVKLDGITSQVTGLEGRMTTSEQTAEGFRRDITGLDGRFTTIEETVNGVTYTGPDGKVMINNGSINLTGAISWGDLDSSAQGQVTAAQSVAATASQNASAALGAASAAQSAVNSVVTYDYQGQTYIDGRKILTGTVTASTIQGGIISLLDGSGYSAGSITLTSAAAASGYYAVDISSGGGMRLSPSGQFWVEALNGQFGLVGSGFMIRANCVPDVAYGSFSLGAPTFLWSAVYSSTGQIQTSDAKLKHDIEPMPDKFLDLLLHLTPKIYRLNDGTSGRLHVGFIAQEVEEAMAACGIDSTEFGGFVKDKDDEGNDIYMLRYEEFIPIIWGALQRRV